MVSNFVVFLSPVSVCIDIDFILAYEAIDSHVSRMSTYYTFATVHKEMSVMDECAHVAVRLQLLEMSSITTLIQTISNVCTWYIFQSSFWEKYWVILLMCKNETLQYAN